MATIGKMNSSQSSLKAAYQKFLPQLQNDISEEPSMITLYASPDVKDEVINPPTLESNTSCNIQPLPTTVTTESDPRSFQAIRNRKYRNSFCSDNVFTDGIERDEENDNNISHTLEPDNIVDGPSSPERLDKSNIGHNLLMKMGWSGTGGVGKNEDGIVDPIVLVGSKNRGGIGHADQNEEPQKKKQKIEKLKMTISLKRTNSQKKKNSGIVNRTTHDIIIARLLKYLSLSGTDRDAKEILKSSCDAADLTLEVKHVNNNETYCYGIYVQGSLLSLGYAREIEEAKTLAFQNTLAVITAKQKAQEEPAKPFESKQDDKCTADNENCSSVGECNSTLPIPNFTLIILNLDDTKDSDIVPLECQYFLNKVGIPVMSIIESCRCSKSGFYFKTQNNPNEVTLTIKGDFVALGVGETFEDARLDAATKGLEVLKEKQPVIYKSIKEVFLHENEVIAGLWLSYDKVSEKGLGYDYEVINNSCAKCHLNVDWYTIPPKLNHGKASWSTILVIGSKIVCVATKKTKKQSLKLCSQVALSFLQKMVELLSVGSNVKEENVVDSDNVKEENVVDSNNVKEENVVDSNSIKEGENSVENEMTKDESISPSSTGEEIEPSSLPPEINSSVSSVSSELVPGLTLLLRSRGYTKNHLIAESIITQSCKFSNISFKAPGTRKGDVWVVNLIIGKILVATGSAKKLKEARTLTFQKSIPLLETRQVCKYKSEEKFLC